MQINPTHSAASIADTQRTQSIEQSRKNQSIAQANANAEQPSEGDQLEISEGDATRDKLGGSGGRSAREESRETGTLGDATAKIEAEETLRANVKREVRRSQSGNQIDFQA